MKKNITSKNQANKKNKKLMQKSVTENVAAKQASRSWSISIYVYWFIILFFIAATFYILGRSHGNCEVKDQANNVEITEDKLKDAIKLCNEERTIMKEFFSLAKLVPSPVKGTEMHDVMNSSNFKFDKKQFFEEIKQTIKNVKEKYEKGETPFTKDTPRILITGCPTGGVVDKVIKQIEEIGGSVVCIENCVGTKNFEML